MSFEHDVRMSRPSRLFRDGTVGNSDEAALMARLIALILAYLFLGLAMVGVFLPGLPTVPLLLVSAWFAARGSERLHRWLYSHPQFGKLLVDWEQQRAISRKSKVIAVLMLSAGWGVMYYRLDNPLVLTGSAVFFIGLAAYLISRPVPD